MATDQEIIQWAFNIKLIHKNKSVMRALLCVEYDTKKIFKAMLAQQEKLKKKAKASANSLDSSSDMASANEAISQFDISSVRNLSSRKCWCDTTETTGYPYLDIDKFEALTDNQKKQVVEPIIKLEKSDPETFISLIDAYIDWRSIAINTRVFYEVYKWAASAVTEFQKIYNVLQTIHADASVCTSSNERIRCISLGSLSPKESFLTLFMAHEEILSFEVRDDNGTWQTNPHGWQNCSLLQKYRMELLIPYITLLELRDHKSFEAHDAFALEYAPLFIFLYQTNIGTEGKVTTYDKLFQNIRKSVKNIHTYLQSQPMHCVTMKDVYEPTHIDTFVDLVSAVYAEIKYILWQLCDVSKLVQYFQIPGVFEKETLWTRVSVVDADGANSNDGDIFPIDDTHRLFYCMSTQYESGSLYYNLKFVDRYSLASKRVILETHYFERVGQYFKFYALIIKDSEETDYTPERYLCTYDIVNRVILFSYDDTFPYAKKQTIPENDFTIMQIGLTDSAPHAGYWLSRFQKFLNLKEGSGDATMPYLCYEGSISMDKTTLYFHFSVDGKDITYAMDKSADFRSKLISADNTAWLHVYDKDNEMNNDFSVRNLTFEIGHEAIRRL